MHLQSPLLLVTLFLSGSLAAPTPAKELKGRSFQIDRIAPTNFTRNGPAAVRKAFRKYGWSFSGGLLSGFVQSTNSSGGDTGEVTATPESNDQSYLCPVSIGGQTLMLDFDTGSADLWVFNTDLPAAETTGHTNYNPSKSSTFQEIQGASFQITYGDQSGVSGKVGTDTVNIGGATVTSQAVELATQVSQQFVADTDSDGLVGLAFSSINTVQPNQQKTFFDNVQSSLEQPLFTANLKHATPGKYEFGTIDTSAFSGSLSYVDVDSSSGFWQFPSTSYVINGKTSTNSSASPAIADTGTSLLLADDDVVNAYWGEVSGAQYDSTQGGYTFPCNADLPDLGIGIGDSYTATIAGSLLNYNEISSSTCFGGLQSNAGQGVQIFGDVMFKSQFVVFDNTNNSPRLGFAPHA